MSHLNNVFHEQNTANNLGQGNAFPSLGAQQQQQNPPCPSFQEAFPTFWQQCLPEHQAHYTQNMNPQQQQDYYGAWYANYQVWWPTQFAAQQPVYQQPAESSSFNAGASSFTTESSGFVPGGGFVATDDKEEFPDFGAIGEKPSKKKQAPKKKADEPTPEELLTTHKGKPSKFFDLPISGKPNSEQMAFIYTYYPEYGSEENFRPFFASVRANAEAYEAANKPYTKKKAKQAQQYYDESSEEETGFGAAGGLGGGSKKTVVKTKADAKAVAAKKAEQEKLKLEQVQKKNADKINARPTATTVKANDKKVTASSEITVVDESRQPVSMVFIGHVDAGKSTICGQMMLQMGAVDERQIEAYKIDAKKQGRDSWWLAYCMDNSEEEKAKGKTVEMGRAYFDTASKQFTIFDAPGHKNYVPNMIMGACLADYGGLVVSARKGEFEAGFESAGQTREHVHLAKSLGIQKLLVVVNKMDEPSVEWAQARFDEVQEKITPFLLSTGFAAEDICYVPISGITGDGMKDRVSPDVCDWYKGPSLMEILESLPLPAGREPNLPLRIPILDKVQIENSRTIYGKVESGTVKLGDKVLMMPNDHPCQVGVIKDSQYREVEYARPGENVQITLLNVTEDSQCNKGDVLCHRENVCPTAEVFEAEIEILELLTYKPIMSRGYSCMMHMHTFADECVVKDILISREKDPAGVVVEKIKPQYIRSNAKATVRIVFKKAVPLEKYATLPQLGRFTLRDEGKTIGLGQIVKYKPANSSGAPANAGLVRQMATAKITEGKAACVDVTFDSETGTEKPTQKAMEAIAEEDN